MNNKCLSSILLAIVLVLFSSVSVAEQGKRVTTLWSDKKECFTDGAFLIAIEALNNTYRVAACAPMGCRISTKEFGKKEHVGSYKEDPRFTWFSESEFETRINGSKKHFYHCLTK